MTSERDSPFPSRDEIARRARELFIQRGRPSGPATQFWFEAEQQLLSRAARLVLRPYRAILRSRGHT